MYKSWSIRDIGSVSGNGLNVFSFFSCGGGSTMGYKLAGYHVLGNCEIDKQINKIYQKNHDPQYSYNMDIRDFIHLPNRSLPDELFNLDILDGSPPCSVFSLAGKREDDWGKEKYFREGQTAQRLDDLFFEYIKVIDKLKPKVFIAENVKGIMFGNAKGYMNEIIRLIDGIGYVVQIFCLNSAKMGVPQRRERVFFFGYRKDLKCPRLRLHHNQKAIVFRDVRSDGGKPTSENSRNLLRQKILTDRTLSDINERLYHKNTGFNSPIVWDNMVAPTILANGEFFRAYDDMKFSESDFINCQTFPFDYDFCGLNAQYICGMSVPPFMMKTVATQVAEQWLLK